MKDVHDIIKKVFQMYGECGDLMLDLGELAQMMNKKQPTGHMNQSLFELNAELTHLRRHMLEVRRCTHLCKALTATELEDINE